MDVSTIFIDPPELHLIHYGKKEVLALISLLEPEWDQPMTFGDNLGDKDTTPAATKDPSQRLGIVSDMPKMNVPLRLQQRKMSESDALGLESEYDYRRLVAYLKANSSDPEWPYSAFSVSRQNHQMFIL